MNLEETKEIPSIDLLEKLIIDDKYFYEFSNNTSEFIYGFNVKEITRNLKDYIISMMNAKKDLSAKFLERAKYYNDKFNLDIPKFRQISDGLNEEFYNYIMKGINNLKDPLAQARAIYLKLAEVLCYDEHFVAYNQNLTNPVIQDIYYSRSSGVTLENNRVTCNLWATVYVEFLRRLGIDAKVISKGKHKLVEFVIEEEVYTADATNSFFDNDNIYLNDFTRVKLNSPTLGFSKVDKIIDQQIGFNPQSLIEQYHDFLNNHYALSSMRLTTGNSETDTIISTLDYLSTMAYHLPLIEAVGYLKQMVRTPNSIVTEEEVNKIMPRQIRLKDEAGVAYTSLVIVVNNNGEYIYKLLNGPKDFITVDKSYFENLISSGQMLDDGNIPGINQMNR